MTEFTPDFEERVKAARAATLALYLDDPSPEGARLMVVFEQTVQALRVSRGETVEPVYISPDCRANRHHACEEDDEMGVCRCACHGG